MGFFGFPLLSISEICGHLLEISLLNSLRRVHVRLSNTNYADLPFIWSVSEQRRNLSSLLACFRTSFARNGWRLSACMFNGQSSLSVLGWEVPKTRRMYLQNVKNNNLRNVEHEICLDGYGLPDASVTYCASIDSSRRNSERESRT